MRRLNLSLPAGPPDLPRLMMMSDTRRLPDPEEAARRLPKGAALILRHYKAPGRAALARRLAILCQRRGLRLLIAGDPRLAAGCGAAGLHLAEWDHHQIHGWRRQHPEWLITAAAHGTKGLIRAARAGADAALLSPAFATASHPDGSALGPWRFAALSHQSRLPVYALGGLSQGNLRRLKGSAAIGIAGIGLFC